jgi:hypothetical protein
MSDKPASETPLHIRQAEGLRQLADAVEQSAEFAKQIQFALEQMHNFAVSGDVRADLIAFKNHALNAGAQVVINNKPSECEVRATFSGIDVTRSATSSRMAGEKPNVLEYEPLVVED